MIQMSYIHSELPSTEKVEVAKIKVIIKRHVTETLDPARKIIATEGAGMSDAGAVNIATFSSMQRSIRLNRQVRHQYPNPLVHVVMPELPNECRQTTSCAQFLVFDTGVGDPNMMIIFDSQNAINLLRTLVP